METSKPNRISKDGKVKLLSIVVILLLGMEIGQTLRGLENFNGQDNFQLIQVAHALSTPGNFLTFQGKLTDASGNPIATLKNMAFSIYDQLTAGNLVYNETQNVTPDANGIFYVNIGCASASTSNVCTGLSATTGNPAGSQTWPPSFSQPYWLAVRVGTGGTYLSPRVTLTQAPYAMNRAAAPILTQVTSAAAACTINTATANQGGFTTPSTYATNALSSGSIRVGMTFTVASPATVALTSKWQFVYGTGAAPACNTTVTGTAVGKQYTIQTEIGAVGSWGQSISVVITGLIPSTTYWFDLQVTDSSTGAWIYSGEQLAISDVLSAVNVFPALKEVDNANTCTHTAAATTLMSGLGATYLTLPSGIGSGTVKVALSFQITTPAVTTITQKWQITYGSTATPACNAAATGTLVGKQYTVETDAAAVLALEQSGSVVIQGLTAATTYWFDVTSTDSSTDAGWITSLPTVTIREDASPAGGNIPANTVYPLSGQTAACVTTAAATTMAGMKELYTATSSSNGKIYGTLTFNILASGSLTAGRTTAAQIMIADITSFTMPACAAAAPAGTLVGNTITFEEVSGTIPYQSAGEIRFVASVTAGHTYWVDLQVVNTGATQTWTYSLPTLTIIDVLKADVPHNNMINLVGSAIACTISSVTAGMAGNSVIPTTAFPPMFYQTTSYGTGNVRITMMMQASVATVDLSTIALFAYGTVTDPQSGVAATANPACAAAVSGTTTASQSNAYADAVASINTEISVTVTLSLSKGTMYWFDFQMTDSTTATWTFTKPTVSIIEAA